MIKSPGLEFESMLLREGMEYVAGVDEAGRGPVAGPVTAAAVLLPIRALLEESIDAGNERACVPSLPLVRDSKALSESQRELAAEALREKALNYAVAHVPNETIDEINILNATRLAVMKAVESLEIRPSVILIDGKFLNLKDRACISIVKGDSSVFSIAAASILAKTSRDALMRQYAKEFPPYAFERNKGYLTEEHLEAVRSHGLSSIHRRSFTISV